MRIREDLACFAVGGAGYTLLELLWRGRTHWTMAVTGGVCFAVLQRICRSKKPHGLMGCCIRGCLAITVAELLVGRIVNLRLHWNVWDYSALPLNFQGQICVEYSALWFLLCLPLCALLRKLGAGR